MGALRDRTIEGMRLSGYSDKTIRLYVTCIGRLARHYMRSPLSLSTGDIADFFLHLRASGRSEATVHVYNEALKLFYAMNDLASLMPRVRVARRPYRVPVVLGKGEVARLLDACASLRYRTVFTIVYSAGLRVSEASNLALGDLDFERGLIHVRAGKGRKDRYTILALGARGILADYLDAYRPCSHLFYAGADRDRKLSPGAIQRRFRELVAASGIRKEAHVHTLRHSFATHLLEDGTSIFHIMRLLGHANIQTTLVYLHARNLEDLAIRSPFDSLPAPAGTRAGSKDELPFPPM